MNLPPPFHHAKDVRFDLTGRIALVDDADGKVLAHVPLATAHEILKPDGLENLSYSHNYGQGYHTGEGWGYGFSSDAYGEGYAKGDGFGLHVGYHLGDGQSDSGYDNGSGPVTPPRY